MQDTPLEWLQDGRNFQDQAFARNHGLLTIEEQDALSNAVVAIPGMGGVGGQHLISLVRTGFRRFRLADPDSFELVNTNRQYGATTRTFGQSKLDVMAEQATLINPYAEIEKFSEGVTFDNLDAFLVGATVVVDSLDFFAFAIRRKLFMRARELGIPVITAGPLGFSTALLVFTPEGMSFDEYFDIHDVLSDEEKFLHFAMGLSPRGMHFRYIDRARVSLKRRKGPSSYIACQLCAAVATNEAVRLVLKRPGIRPVPCYLQFDPYIAKFKAGRLFKGNRNPMQRLKLAIAQKFLISRGERIGHCAPSTPNIAAGSSVNEDVFSYILCGGIAAPSGDNVQPWSFSLSQDKINVHMRRDADVSFFNFNQFATLISCGAVLENLVIAASALHLKTEVCLTSDIGVDGSIGSVSLAPGGREDPLSEVLWERCTNRRLFSCRPVAASIIERLKNEVEKFGCHLHVLEGNALRPLSKVVYQADRIRTEHKGLHEYFNSMIRFAPEEESEMLDGLPLKNLYAGIAGEAFLKLTKPWKRMKVANALGLGRMVAMHSARGILHSGAACLLTVPGRNVEDILTGGRALERCWLKLTALGLSMQPMTAITLFRLRWDIEGPNQFLPNHRLLLESLWPQYDNLFPKADFKHDTQIMLFRIGYAKPIIHGTWRKPPNYFVQK